jgi:hypothetical protein
VDRSESNISGDKTENSIGNPDFWIVKTDSLGIIQWQNTIGGMVVIIFIPLHKLQMAGIFWVDYSSSDISGDKTENSNGVFDFWIVKTDSLGVIQWQNTIGGSEMIDFILLLKLQMEGIFG